MPYLRINITSSPDFNFNKTYQFLFLLNSRQPAERVIVLYDVDIKIYCVLRLQKKVR